MIQASRGHASDHGDGQTFERVYNDELRYIVARRQKTVSEPTPVSESTNVATTLIGLALSGGGIRSATTNLGILQALSKMGILPMVDYLCTVSGGGYIGSCLSSLLSLNKQSVSHPGNTQQHEFEARADALFTTEWEHFPFREERTQDEQRAEGGEPGGLTGQAQVKHLRTHGNFLVARLGVFARETMRSLGSLLTGIVYHFLIVLLVLFSGSALYVGTVSPLSQGSIRSLPQDLARLWEPPPTDIAGTRTRIETTTRPPGEGATAIETRTEIRGPTVWDHLKHKAKILRDSLGAFLGTFGALQQRFILAFGLGATIGLLSFAGIALASVPQTWSAIASRLRWWLEPEPGESEEDVFERRVLVAVSGLAAAAVLVAVVGIRWGTRNGDPLLWLFLPFAVLVGARSATFLLHLLTPWMRSLWTRRFRSLWGSFQAATTYGVALSLGLALFPLLIYALAARGLGPGIGELIGAAVALVGGRLLAGRFGSSPRGNQSLPQGLVKFALGTAAGLFVLLMALVFCTAIVSLNLNPWIHFAWAGLLFVLAGATVNSNKISPHYFYRDRLTETYLRTEVDDGYGKMRTLRNSMEMPLTALHGTPATAHHRRTDDRASWGSTAPYHLLSVAINLAGSPDLTRKDRKSGYFLFSKLYCGSEQTRFRPTDQYRAGETRLARAMTISGAAAAPAMGYHTFFAQAFVLTLFNVRLGYWMENPRRKTSVRRKEGRVFWPKYLLKEVFSDTHVRGRLVNLSDGGHTGDNVGISPLLQRRCKIIIACDAEADGELTFGSFTEALRHAYVDRGIDVDIDLTMLRRDPRTGRSQRHCAVGRIRYPDRPHQRSWLIYLKTSLTGDEPEPVLNYASDHPAFPHETTADQFFDDAQFDSYRSLGVHIAEHSFGPWVSSDTFEAMQAAHSPFVQPHNPHKSFDEDRAWVRLQHLHSPFKASDEPVFLRTTDALVKLQRLFLSDEDLKGYYEECYLEGSPVSAATHKKIQTKISQACMIQTQLMEDTFFALRLDRYANAPDNRGWMNLFRRWGRTQTFKAEFDRLKGTFSSDFVEFFEHHVKECYPIDVAPVRHPWDPPDRKPEARVPRGIFLDPGRREA